MQMDDTDKYALDNTIRLAGFSGNLNDFECIAFSKPDLNNNKNVRAIANEYLLQVLLSNEIGHCIHVTGKMRALVDPFHRRLCIELAKRSNTRFTVIYDPESYSSTPEGVGEWNEKSWRGMNWADKLSTMNVIGESLVDVRAYNTDQEIQYSVFGNKFILLQERHFENEMASGPRAKRVWLLKSEKINEFLTEKALDIVKNSKNVPDVLFKRFTTRINGLIAKSILAKLCEVNKAISLDEITSNAMLAFEPDISKDIMALKNIGFIKEEFDGTLIITKDGSQYFETIS